MNKKCLALTEEQYKESIQLMRSGFINNGVVVKPNARIAMIGVVQASLGIRLGDTLRLKLSSFIKDGNRYRLDIMEEKTKKIRNFTVPLEVYSYIQQYAIDCAIGYEEKLFDVSKRQVERHLNKVFDKMGLPLRNYGSHSYRKFFATKIYMDNEMNIELVRVLLQHSTVAVTQKYIGISQKTVEDALAKTVTHLI